MTILENRYLTNNSDLILNEMTNIERIRYAQDIAARAKGPYNGPLEKFPFPHRKITKSTSKLVKDFIGDHPVGIAAAAALLAGSVAWIYYQKKFKSRTGRNISTSDVKKAYANMSTKVKNLVKVKASKLKKNNGRNIKEEIDYDFETYLSEMSYVKSAGITAGVIGVSGAAAGGGIIAGAGGNALGVGAAAAVAGLTTASLGLIGFGLIAAVIIGGNTLYNYIKSAKPDQEKIEAAKIVAKNVTKIKDSKVKSLINAKVKAMKVNESYVYEAVVSDQEMLIEMQNESFDIHVSDHMISKAAEYADLTAMVGASVAALLVAGFLADVVVSVVQEIQYKRNITVSQEALRKAETIAINFNKVRDPKIKHMVAQASRELRRTTISGREDNYNSHFNPKHY